MMYNSFYILLDFWFASLYLQREREWGEGQRERERDSSSRLPAERGAQCRGYPRTLRS